MSDKLSVSEWRQRQDADRDARREEMDRRRDSARDMHKEAADAQRAEIEAREAEAAEFIDAGYEETMPGQAEVVAGTVQHEQLLNAYHNATSYGPDVNVVVPEPEAPPGPPPEEDGVARTEEEQRRIAMQEQERADNGRE